MLVCSAAVTASPLALPVPWCELLSLCDPCSPSPTVWVLVLIVLLSRNKFSLSLRYVYIHFFPSAYCCRSLLVTTISKKKERKFESGVLTAALLQMGRLACQQHQNALLSVQGPLRAEL